MEHVIHSLSHGSMSFFAFISLVNPLLFLLTGNLSPLNCLVAIFFIVSLFVFWYLGKPHELLLYFSIGFVHIVNFNAYFINYRLSTNDCAWMSAFNAWSETPSVAVSVWIYTRPYASLALCKLLVWHWWIYNFFNLYIILYSI